MGQIQSTNLPLWLSEDGVIFKQLVCLENYTLSMDTPSTKTDTFCGSVTAVGLTTFSIAFSAVCHTSPSASQVTLNDCARWQINQTLLHFKMQSPSTSSAGTLDVFFAGDLYVTASSYVAAVNDAVKFTGTLTGNGTLDYLPTA